MNDYIRDIISDRQRGILSGIASYCTANEFVLRSLIKNAKKNNKPIIIEATSNQVNQDYGYTGMNSFEFVDYINQLCREYDFPEKMVIKGGDHLGPLPWSNLESEIAMGKAEELVRMSVRAGFKKIHLDTTMKLADDPDEFLSDEIIAKRSARLYKACEEEYQELLKKNPNETHPVFVIGSEVPYAGGIRNESESVDVTTTEQFENTLATFHSVFKNEKIQGAWNNIIAVVVQPGVDFGSDRIQLYNRAESKILCNCLKQYPGMVFEGHSTDYQPKQKLKEMVEDGIAILKVGPALTFAFREAIFALSYIEDLYYEKGETSSIREVLDSIMVGENIHWKKYYRGTEKEIRVLRSYGLSDRCRYYFVNKDFKDSYNRLISNLVKISIPLGLIHQFLPNQYQRIIEEKIDNDCQSIIEDHVLDVVRNYEYATNFRFISD